MQETTSDGITVCSATAAVAPAIKIQVILPTETWTQRYRQMGCGGLGGNISLHSGASAGCQVLNSGDFVMAATDIGKDDSWGLDPLTRPRRPRGARPLFMTAPGMTRT
ncbi:MAG: tannase/feruloyl esterase family alpha/beta hydrolase [Gammaproteobacteria bacterium]